LASADRYRYQVINDDVDQALGQLREILSSLDIERDGDFEQAGG
jgi:guanylate kinase